MLEANKKNMNKLLILLYSISIFSCQPNQSEIAALEINLEDLKEQPSNENQLDRKLIKNGDLEFETSNLSETTKSIKTKLKSLKGYVSTERDVKSDDRQSKTLTLRIPANTFDSFIAELDKTVENFDYKEISVKDVTEEFIDIQARLKNKKATEEKFQNLLSKANSVNDILNIEKQLGEIRGEIESVEGRLKLLENQVNFSTLNMTFYKLTTGKNNFFYRVKNAIFDGWKSLLSFIVLLFDLWPFLILAIVGYYGIKRLKRKD
jgi:flagellar biosynthesis chaperone FliJ